MAEYKVGSEGLHPTLPRLPDGPKPIQLVYHNTFASIWEYELAFRKGEIDWPKVIGQWCPICGDPADFRQIGKYERVAIDLFAPNKERCPDNPCPWRQGRIPIARFQCRKKLRTFSLLPYQLAPYHRYTVRSILGVLVWVALYKNNGGSVATAMRTLAGDSNVERNTLHPWLRAALDGFKRAHPVLSQSFDLEPVVNASRQSDPYAVVLTYMVALHAHDPPGGDEIDDIGRHLAKQIRHPFLGTLSQHRPRLV